VAGCSRIAPRSARGTTSTTKLEGEDVATTFHNDTLEGELLLSHKRTGTLVGSVGGWFMTRDFKAIGEEALTPAVAQKTLAGFVYEEVESAHATLQFGGRFDHSNFDAGAESPRAHVQ
jgi:iron complex outermembrane receptor protein